MAMLTKGEFVARAATILAEYMTVMDAGREVGKDEFIVDGKRLLGVIESLTQLMSEMEPQMKWPSEVPLGFQYN